MVNDFLEHLRRINVDRCVNAFEHPLQSWSALEWAGAAAGEMGEATNVAKKIKRVESLPEWLVSRLQDTDLGSLNKDLADEVADTIIYLDLLCARQGIDLADAIRQKFNRTSEKVGYDKTL